MTDLKPCPFCGAVKNHLSITRWLGDDWYYVVRCNLCGGSVSHGRNTTPELATEAWNRRDQ